MLIFDIETGPRPDILDVMPEFELPPHPGEFNPNSVKTGNLKDPVKIQEKYDSAMAAHEKRVAEYEKECAASLDAQRQAFIENAPLSAAYGQVVAIGFYNPDKNAFACLHGEESEVLGKWWDKVHSCIATNRLMVGLNIHDFDLPFLIRRSWSLGIDFPRNVVSDLIGKWPKWHPCFVDLRKVWLLGCHPSTTKSNFDTLAAAFGTTGKGDVTGDQFWKLWASPETRKQAIDYLENDVRQPADWVRRMLA